MCLAQGHNTVKPVRFEPTALRSRVKRSTTEPLCSQITVVNFPKSKYSELKYGKCFKILNTFLSLFSNKILVISAGSHKILVRIANREDPDQTTSKEAV